MASVGRNAYESEGGTDSAEAQGNGNVPRVRRTHRVTWSVSTVVALFSVSALVGGCSDLSEAGSATTTPASTTSPSTQPPTATPTPVFDLDAARSTNTASEVANRRAWAAAYSEATTGEPVAAAADTRDTRTAMSIAYVIDGDTVVTSSGDSVRIIGIDSPEHGLCGFAEATEYATQQLLDQAVTLIATTAEPDGDKYGRLLRYVELQDGSDFGLLQIQQGNAAARFDGYDGYAAHPRQETYHHADDAVTHRCADENPARTGVAAVPEPAVAVPAPLVEVPAPASTDLWNLPGPDLDCKDIGKKVHVDPPDYHRLDKDGDGWGCESYG